MEGLNAGIRWHFPPAARVARIKPSAKEMRVKAGGSQAGMVGVTGYGLVRRSLS